MPSEISIPFRLNGSGQIATETVPNAQVRQHVMSLLNTQPGERVVYSDYGVPLADSLFEADSAVTQELPDIIDTAFARWEPGVQLTAVNPETTDNPWDGAVNVNISYLRTDAPDTTVPATTTNVAVVSPGGAVTEVIRG